MTNKEFFLETLKDEAPRFRKAIEALPEDKHGYKVHERSREAGNLAAQLAVQWKAISGILTIGKPSFDPHEMGTQTKADMLAKFDQGMPQLEKDVRVLQTRNGKMARHLWEKRGKIKNIAWHGGFCLMPFIIAGS
jgi:hypothetical protein